MGPPCVVSLTTRANAHITRHLERTQSNPSPSSPDKVMCCTRTKVEHRHFFCPRNPRNRELHDCELPTVDTVRRTRSFFEAKLPLRSSLWTDSCSVSSGVSSADHSSQVCKTESLVTSSEDEAGPASDWEEDDPSADELFYRSCSSSPPHIIPAIVMERIRARGWSTTYYGGRVVATSTGNVSPTRTILTEIQRSAEYQAWLNPRSGQPRRDFSTVRSKKDAKEGCRLIKSNSCDSRLEIINLTPEQQRSEDSVNTNMKGRSRSEPRVDRRDTDISMEERRKTWDSRHWPGKTSIIFDFRNSRDGSSTLNMLQCRPRRKQNSISGVVAEAHAKLAASSSTTL